MPPHVLLVDDEAGALEDVRRVFEKRTSVELLHPQSVTEDHLAAASLVLVDYELKSWDERDSQSCASMQPLNGVALASVYRSFAKERFRRPVAVALYSGRLSELAPIPSETRPHVLANLGSLEWVFSKVDPRAVTAGQDLENLVRSSVSLASAVEALPPAWPVEVDQVRWQVQQLLASPTEGEDAAAFWGAIAQCHPPMYEMSTASHGMWFLDWMLYHILPYSTFLIDRMSLGAMLKFVPTALDEVLKGDSVVADRLRSVEYTGVLHDFNGRRWWQPGVAALAKDMRDATPEFHVGARIEAVTGVSGTWRGDFPVVCYDGRLAQLPTLYEVSEAVEIRPDLWPAFARQAYAPRHMMEDPAIATLAERAATMAFVPLSPGD